MNTSWCTLVVLLTSTVTGFAAERPNVLLVITDDQGYGDLGCHGNPVIKTPTLDRLASQSVRLDRFYVSPVCSPTRASLMTGRYNYRTGVVDTFIGRSMMHPDEVTLAEMLGSAGYRTGIFGKWHLGDNYPLRAMDQGFQECLVHQGGGLMQPSDPPGNTYFDPILMKNGKTSKTRGYCSDVFADAAIDFVSQKSDRPFFAYLAFNAPHGPLHLPEADLAPYRRLDLSESVFPRLGHPIGKINADETARVYGMVTNLDRNLGRLFARLEELKLADNTLVIFLTDNGPQQVRYNAGMFQRKGNVHEGGIRVPGYVRWPVQLKAGHTVKQHCAHIDLTPTVLDACGVAPPKTVAFDGRSLLPLLKAQKTDWPERTLYFQWHRGEVPIMNRAFAARSSRYKLLQPAGVQPGPMPFNSPLKLYDMIEDPLEEKNLVGDKPEIVAEMKRQYQAWFKDVSTTRGFDPPRIHLGAPQENPSTLTRQDWRGPNAGWEPKSLGHWEVQIARAGTYRVTLRFPPLENDGPARFSLAGVSGEQQLKPGVRECVFPNLQLVAGPTRLEATVERDRLRVGVHYVEVERVDPTKGQP